MTAACGSEQCVTCSDGARPMQVLAVAPSALARCVDEDGVASHVMIDLVGDVIAGDVVLVHAGTAIAVTERAERVR